VYIELGKQGCQHSLRLLFVEDNIDDIQVPCSIWRGNGCIWKFITEGAKQIKTVINQRGSIYCKIVQGQIHGTSGQLRTKLSVNSV